MRFLVLALCLGGCAPIATEGDRLLIHQNIGAAQAILGASTDPAITIPAHDIVLNSERLQSDLGSPESPTSYSPAASAIFRQQAAREHSRLNLLYKKFASLAGSMFPTALSTIPGLGGLVGMGLALFKTYQARKTGEALEEEQTAHQHTAQAFEDVSADAPTAAAKHKKILKKAHSKDGVEHIGKRVASNV